VANFAALIFCIQMLKFLLFLEKSKAMKKFIIFTVVFTFMAGLLAAQNPTTTWPYVNNDFSKATVYLKSGGKLEYLANIHLQDCQLHYVKSGKIMEASLNDILVVELASKRYMNINNY
jgi:hypothetical protein